MPKVRTPNIFWLQINGLGFADPGCFGAEHTTPHIDSLANRGIRFTGFTVHPREEGQQFGENTELAPVSETDLRHPEPFSTQQFLLANTLRDHGYQIRNLNDHAVGAHDRRTGNETTPLFLSGQLSLTIPDASDVTPAAAPASLSRHDWCTARKARFKRQIIQGLLPQSWALPTPTGTPESGESTAKDHPAIASRFLARRQEEMARIDTAVGGLVDLAEQRGGLDDTMFILSGTGPAGSLPDAFDCGDFPSTPFRRDPRLILNGDLRAPLIIRWTGALCDQGSVRRRWLHQDDLPSTILDLVGIADGSAGPGSSAAAMVRNATARSPRTSAIFRRNGHVAYIRNMWKLVSVTTDQTNPSPDSWHLYDLGSDPTETRNLAHQLPDLVQVLVAELAQHS